MPVYSGFAIPTLSMMSQAHSLNTIGNNIANVTTGGFKRTDTNFSTLLSARYDKQSDIGGITPKDLNRIGQQGNVVTSTSDLDIAINGHGFFVFNSQQDGSGDTYYGRDGTFNIATGGTISVTGNNGLNITTKDGYLVDKNGYYLQGRTADPITGLFTSTAMTSLRVDQYAFSSIGQATTTAGLGLNLPASDEIGYGQADSIQLTGTIEAGDTYSVTVNGTSVSYVTTGGEADLNAVRDALVAKVNADTTVSALATASASPTDGALVITGVAHGIDLTVSSVASNVAAGVADNIAELTAVQAAVAGTTHSYNIEVIDSSLNARSARLDFSKTGTNTWSVKQTLNAGAVAQVDTMTISGAVEAGDVYVATVNGVSVSYTVTGAEGSVDAVRDAIVAAINANATVGGVVTAAAGTTGKLTLTADTEGTSFISSALSTNRTPVAQIDKVTIQTGVAEINDVYTTTVAGGTYTYTASAGDSQTVIANDLATQINANPLVSAANVGGVITVTAATAGTGFTNAVTAVTDADLDGNALTATDAADTLNVTAGANTAATATTTANVSTTATTTTDIGTIAFDENGNLITPTSETLTLNLSFPIQGSLPAGTSTVTLDVSDITQFAGSFLPTSYTKNGFAKANLRGINFNALGEVVAQFENSTARGVYKIPLAQFMNPNGLTESNGNVYQSSDASGDARVVDVAATGYATFLPNSRELSNVDMAGEFSRMIMTQTAYNSSATVFKTVDEMLTYARDLKS